MTHDERIKAMAEAIFKADFPDDEDLWDECEGDMQAVYNRMATAALAAAGVEEMVREAAREAWDLGCMSETSDIEQRNEEAEEIVREVMGR
jgi:hypothetical protein